MFNFPLEMSDQMTIQELREIVAVQQAKIQELEVQVKHAFRLAEQAETYSRQDCLILRGTKKAPLASKLRSGMPLRVEVARLLWEHTRVELQPWSINTAHWLKFESSIIVRFNNKELRNMIYSRRIPREREQRGSLIIHECLSKAKSELVDRLVGLKAKKIVHSYWTQNGHVYVKGSEKSPRMLVVPDWSDEQIKLRLANQPTTYSNAAKPQPEHAYSETAVKSLHPVHLQSHSQTNGQVEPSCSHHTVQGESEVQVGSQQPQNQEGDGTGGEESKTLNAPTALSDLSSKVGPNIPPQTKQATQQMPSSKHTASETHSASSESDGHETPLLTPPTASYGNSPLKKTPSPQSVKKQKRSQRRRMKF